MSSLAVAAAACLIGAPAFAGVIYDNGPVANSFGTGVGGADESILQTTSLGMNTLGFGHQVSAGNRIADDFVVDGPGWLIDTFTFFAYQTGSPTTSTITAVNFQIWDGEPGQPGSSVIFGDTVTNRLLSTDWSGIYRVSETTTGTATNRPIMANVADAGGFMLAPGTYWVDWQTDGSLASGPWAPPITINGQASTGNGIQFTASWAPAEDSGTLTPQGFPFLISGSMIPAPGALVLLGLAGLAPRRRRR